MFLYFQIKYSRFFAEILSFSFYLSNYECGACLAVDQSLVYGNYPNMFLLFFSLILSLIPVLKPSFLMSWFRFVFLLDLLELCHLVYSFFIHNEMNASQFKPKEHICLNFSISTNFYAFICDIAFCSCFFVFIPGFTY